MLYFGKLTEVVPEGEEIITLEASTIEEVINRIIERHPTLAEEAFAVAHNCNIVNERSTRVKDGDEIALLPPVSGG